MLERDVVAKLLYCSSMHVVETGRTEETLLEYICHHQGNVYH